MKKNIILTKIFTFVFVLSVFSSLNFPGDAHAAVPCVATAPGTDLCAPFIAASSYITGASAPTTAAAAVTTAGTEVAKFSWDTIGKNTLDYIAYAAAQSLLNKLTQNTITWIRGGFHGSPSFAVDTDEIFTEIADNIAGGMVLALRNISVCEFTVSYKDDLLNTVDLSAKKRPYIYNQKATCPFREDYGFKASEFYQDFSNGGWALMGAALNDSGNPYGLQLVTAKEQASREAEAKAKKEQKLAWSNGFTDILDTTDCNYPPGTFYTADDYSVGGAGSMTQADADRKNEEMMTDPARIKALQEAHCKTTTPGKIIGDQLTKTLGVDMDRIGFSDNMNKIVSAFLETLTSSAVRGVFGKKDLSTASGGRAPAPSTVAPPVVIVTTSPVGNITQTSATLNGFVTSAPYSANVRAWFILGETSASVLLPVNSSVAFATPLGGTAFPVTIPVSTTGQIFSKTVTGLTPNTTYYFSASAISAQPSTSNNLHGAVTSFRTLE